VDITMTDETAAPATVIEVPDEGAQLGFGAALADALGGRTGILFLQGTLGVGKTTLVRGLLRGLGHQGPVRSPTYTLIEPYEQLRPPVHHLDLYRITDPEELDYLGLRDLLDGAGLLVVEWPERGEALLPAPDLCIRIEYAGAGRRLHLLPSPAWRAVVAGVVGALP
jgi:tRNA threonylcarbamoyladenosine biosynthesis protein TsaE